ncbi:hypothetical protein XU18_1738 [Perkinsela sp. CCAP 1560/4]|nr:hypothetical protein XU18_1738 [Perkinsela sp. CCAP 1560/4]|eukprot:KNH07644.1 hypothetical protein XU18_1738 [Perkinsela sp. CCAP 1560/4]
MDEEIKKLILLMHSKKTHDKTLSGKVCVEAIRKKFADKFAKVDNWKSIIEEADALLADLDSRHKTQNSRKRPAVSEDDSSDSTSDSSCSDSETDYTSSDDSESDNSSQESVDGSFEATKTHQDTSDMHSMLSFMRKAGIASAKRSGESEEDYKLRLIEICKENDLDHTNLSKGVLKSFMAKAELKLLQEEADISLPRSERKGRTTSRSETAVPPQTSCSNLVDE